MMINNIQSIIFGTWQINNGNDTFNAVSNALKAGYRHIDTAFDYQNEQSVGEVINKSGIPREEIFLTTKLSATIKDYNLAKKAIKTSLNNLKQEYIDLYIIHAPWPWSEIGKNYNKENIEIYRALEEAKK